MDKLKGERERLKAALNHEVRIFEPLERHAADLRALLAQSEDSARLRAALDPQHWRGKPHSVLVNIVLDLTQASDNDRKDGE